MKELALLKWRIKNKFGVDLSQYRGSFIERRLKARIFATHLDNLSQYLKFLEKHPEEYKRLAEALLINVTKFFRQRKVWDKINYLLDDLIRERMRKNRKRIRLWSAGCATGEEAYSLAILLTKVLGDKIEEFYPRIYASDLDEGALSIARNGIYEKEKVKEVESKLKTKYFEKKGGVYEVKDQIKKLIDFRILDLSLPSPYKFVDMVLCRNVLIYFGQEGQETIIKNIHQSIKPRGYLILGEVESIHPALIESFLPLYPKLRIFQKIK
jgi:two-component system CheB/CheR fusion protein